MLLTSEPFPHLRLGGFAAMGSSRVRLADLDVCFVFLLHESLWFGVSGYYQWMLLNVGSLPMMTRASLSTRKEFSSNTSFSDE